MPAFPVGDRATGVQSHAKWFGEARVPSLISRMQLAIGTSRWPASKAWLNLPLRSQDRLVHGRVPALRKPCTRPQARLWAVTKRLFARPNDDGIRRSVRCAFRRVGSASFPKRPCFARSCSMFVGAFENARQQPSMIGPTVSRPFLSNAGPIEIAPRFVLPGSLRQAVTTTSHYERKLDRRPAISHNARHLAGRRRVASDPIPTMWPTQMTQAGVYGERLGQPLNLKDAPSLITRSLRSAELAVTETRDDDPVRDFSARCRARMLSRQPQVSRLPGLRMLGTRPMRHQDGCPRRRNLPVRHQARSAT
jgi:hypothetical protein